MEDFSDEEEMDIVLAVAHVESRLPFISMSLWRDFIKLAYEEQFQVAQVRVRKSLGNGAQHIQNCVRR